MNPPVPPRLWPPLIVLPIPSLPCWFSRFWSLSLPSSPFHTFPYATESIAPTHRLVNAIMASVVFVASASPSHDSSQASFQYAIHHSSCSISHASFHAAKSLTVIHKSARTWNIGDIFHVGDTTEVMDCVNPLYSYTPSH